MKTSMIAIATLLLLAIGDISFGCQQGESQTKEEFIKYVKGKLSDQPDAFYEKLFAAVDTDSDGSVSAAEFANRMTALQKVSSGDGENRAKQEVDKESDYAKNSRRAAPIDAFPVFDDPKMLDAATSKLKDSEPVIGVVCDGEARAYPVSVMGRHELGNDVCGKTHITVSW